MFLAVLAIPQTSDALERAAAVSRQVRADVQRRLAGVLPRVLMVSADRDELERVCAELEVAGFRALVLDPVLAPGDDERRVARGLELGPGGLVVVEGVGSVTRTEVPAAAITLLQRGTRTSASVETVTTRERKLSLGRAVMTGGLKLTKKVETTRTETTESREAFLLVHRGDGERDVVLYERRVDYGFLGPDRAPASHANFEETIRRIRSLLPAVALDDRVSRPGFVAGIPQCSADPLDVALHLVQLAHVVH